MYRVPAANIVANYRGNTHRIAKLIFARDGGIYVAFPGFPRQAGLVGELCIPPGKHAGLKLSLAHSGKVTSHLVKYAHHPTGEAHFSLDGKVLTKIRRTSVPFATQNGHLFTIQLQGLTAFAPPRKSDKTFNLTFDLKGDFKGFKVSCWRYPLEALSVPSGIHINATPKGVQFRDGQVRAGLFVAPPENCTTSNYVFLLSPEEWTNQDHSPCLIFLGGFDPTPQAFDLSCETRFLAFLYPCSNENTLRSKLGSIDYAG